MRRPAVGGTGDGPARPECTLLRVAYATTLPAAQTAAEVSAEKASSSRTSRSRRPWEAVQWSTAMARQSRAARPPALRSRAWWSPQCRRVGRGRRPGVGSSRTAFPDFGAQGRGVADWLGHLECASGVLAVMLGNGIQSASECGPVVLLTGVPLLPPRQYGEPTGTSAA